jgi:hypothetical protein
MKSSASGKLKAREVVGFQILKVKFRVTGLAEDPV